MAGLNSSSDCRRSHREPVQTRAEALIAFRTYESVMRDQLGVGPSKVMRELRDVIVDEIDMAPRQVLDLVGVERTGASLTIARLSRTDRGFDNCTRTLS